MNKNYRVTLNIEIPKEHVFVIEAEDENEAVSLAKADLEHYLENYIADSFEDYETSLPSLVEVCPHCETVLVQVGDDELMCPYEECNYKIKE